MAPPPSSTSAIHLAAAAFFGASLMAVASFVIHKRSVDRILDRLIELRARKPFKKKNQRQIEEEEDYDDGGDGLAEVEEEEEEEVDEVGSEGFRLEEEEDEDRMFIGGGDERAKAGGLELGEGRFESVPIGVATEMMARRNEVQSINHSISGMSVDTVRSINGYSTRSVADTEDEETELPNGNFNPPQEIGHSTIQDARDAPLKHEMKNHSQYPNGENLHKPKAVVDMPRNAHANSPSTLLLGNDFDVSAIVSLSASMHETFNSEEEEVRKMLRECLELRETYLYREQVAPWKKSSEADAASRMSDDPYHFWHVDKTDHHFQMEDGVIRVYGSKNDNVELFPVAWATIFFTDMHHVLKVVSVGNARSACHKRLWFLEETESFWFRRVHLIVIFTTSGKSIHMCIILLA